MKRILSKMLGGALLFSLTMSLTSCEDILGHWEKPTPNPITPGGGSEGTMAADAAVGDLGKLICTDGHIHADGADAECTKDRVAKICYVGSDNGEAAPYNHGLALALSDVSSTTKWCSQTSTTCFASGHQYDTSTKFNDLAGIANTDALVNNAPAGHTHAAASAVRNYNSGTHPTGTTEWFLPSAGQWDKMIGAAGLSNLGLLENAWYWSSSERNAYNAWIFRSSDGNWGNGGKGGDRQVRACLAF